MKTKIYTSILALTLTLSSLLRAQEKPAEYLGLPGDNLNLFAVMNLFQESETLEAFERNLNDPEEMINNLDLNNDNYVDYIMVFDYKDSDIHNIVLRVALNQNDNQDVAVFIVEKFADGAVRIQLIGDEALYGPNYIVEPNYAETPNPGYRGQTQQQNTEVVTVTYYEVAYWPMIEFMYDPIYVTWASSWYWGCYVPYWHPWRPHFWHYYYGYHWNWFSYYYMYYRPWRYHRCSCYHNGYYASIRHYSPTIVININNGVYTNTYSKPEKKLEGEKLFAERNPNGIDYSRREKNKSAAESQKEGLKTKDSGNTARTGNDDSKSYNIIKTRPAKETDERKGTNDSYKRDNNVSRERPAEPVRTTTKEKQSTESKPQREVKSTNTERKEYKEPARETRSSSSGYDNSKRESKPSSTRENRSSSSSGSSSRSSESKSNSSGSSSSRSEYKSSSGSSSSSSSSKSNDSKSNGSSSKRK